MRVVLLTGVCVRSLVKAWGSTRAVDDISFAVEDGSLAVLLGPSGCGKSTTLRMIAGLEDPTSGTVEIGGRDVAGLTGAARGVAMVFQSYALFPHLSVADNITFGLSVRKTPKPEIRERLDRVAELLDLKPLLARKPGQLSGGQQQRVALGRALIAEAPVCLLDEPLSNLDAKLRQDLRREIRALQQRLGITMIYVTHDQTEAMSMADRVILMRGGRIEQNATPPELYEKPASLFAARFVGGSSMNLIDLENDASGAQAVIAGHDNVPILSCPGRGLVLGLRPEDVEILGESGTSDRSAGHIVGATAEVEEIEYLGADALVTCRIDDRRLTARTRGIAAPSVGQRVRVGWHESAMHIFDGESGRRLDPGDRSQSARCNHNNSHKERETST
ncbi:MAG TPA: ABC transporter ATP-binding protein [Pararhizobium sp.]|nr:ABC transporter ATP-binding protein [Pararhizobium sp.]